MGTVNSMSYGLLSVVPKDENGVEITDFEDHIIYDKNGSELKEWYALASYLHAPFYLRLNIISFFRIGFFPYRSRLISLTISTRISAIIAITSIAAAIIILKNLLGFLKLHIRIFFMIDFFQKHVQRSNPEPAVFV